MSVKRNTFINLAGSIAPILISLITVPLYLHKIGDARYGVLAIVWLLVAYFGLFDLGLSRATSNQIAKLLDAPASQRETVFWTALALNGLFGLCGGLILYGVTQLAFGGLFKVPLALKPELMPTLPWIALAIPIATTSGVLTGSLEGRSRFALVNSIQVGGTALTQGVPLVVAYMHGPELTWLIPSVVLARLASVGPLAWAAARVVPLSKPQLPTKGSTRTLLGYGAWVTITNLVSPLLDAADRLAIGGVLGAKSVTYYSLPYSFATKLNILPGALSRTLFPVLSYENDTEGLRLSAQAVRGLAAALTPLVVLGIVLMRPFLTIWVGKPTADECFGVGEVMLVGAWMNSLSFIPFAQLQGQSRPHVTATFHLIEALPYLAILWLGLHLLGVVGAATAWSLRMIADALLLSWAAGYGFRLFRLLLPGFLLIAATCTATLSLPGPPLLAWTVGAILFILSLVWSLSLDSPARSLFSRLWSASRPARR